GFDDRPARLQLPLAFCRFDHRETDPVLHGTARVQVLELRENLRAAAWAQLVEAHNGRRADKLEDGRELAGHRYTANAALACSSSRPRTSARQAATDTAPTPAST